MSTLRLGGIDPSILRELSGVYKPFVKAFKELVSNSFDADADQVDVEIPDDFSSITISDDGDGMTPFEFRSDFTRIGGGSRRWLGERTRHGRRRIGSKGIGFLALARYCSSLEVESSAPRQFSVSVDLPKKDAVIDLDQVLGFEVAPDILDVRLRCVLSHGSGRRGTLKLGKDYSVDLRSRKIRVLRSVGPLTATISFDCRGLRFRASLDFERLLALADKADLDKLEEFASIELFNDPPRSQRSGTRITASNLKAFVRRELRAERRKGNVRNIASRDGFERFVWHLSRCTPIRYRGLPPICSELLERVLKHPKNSTLKQLRVSCGRNSVNLERPLYPSESDPPPLHKDMLVLVEIQESGLKATGFLAGYESVIFPAEYRGITVRVRGVGIGEPNFFGAEYLLTGASKAALSQITGEINVLAGLDAVDALNPGRESFYEESEQYKILKRCVIGEGESVSGLLGQTVAAVLRRSQVRSSLKDVLGRALQRRKALDDVSAAVTDVIASGGDSGRALRRLLDAKHSHTNGLAGCPDLIVSVPPRVGGLKVVEAQNLSTTHEINYEKQEVLLDMARPEWDWSLVLFDQRVTVQSKKGGAGHPLGELDLRKRRILINGEHPIRTQMDERGFLRTSLSWVLAKEAAGGNADQMMELALRLLSFRTGAVDG